MKRIAKITVALLLAVAMCFSLAGCYDEDLNWSAKYDDTELPAGAYIYYLSIAYNEAASKVSTEDEVLKSEIDGTPAETWIKNRADEYVNQYFYIQNEMKRLGLEMTDEDYSTCLQTTESYWNYFGTSFEKFGIAKTSFDIAYSQYNRMYLKVFNALYGEGGENEVPESELRQHIEDDYYDYEYFSAPLTKTDDDNKSVDLTDEDHLDHAHDVLGRVAQTVDELHGNVELLKHLVDAGAAAVAEHRLEAEELEHHDVVEHGVLELVVDHGVAAVLDDDDLALIFF